MAKIVEVHIVHPNDQLLLDEPEAYESLVSQRTQPWFPRTPGHNVDPIDVDAGLRLLQKFGYDDPKTVMVIQYALQRWASGEEAAAEKGAIDQKFHGVDYTTWRAVLAAAVASGTEKLRTDHP